MFRISALFLLFLSTPAAFADIQKKIVGGEDALKGEYPFIVSLQNQNGHFCGGTLIRKDWVLTAAHCISGRGPEEILVGLHSRSKTDEAESFRPAQVIRHPKYSPFTLDYDFALLRLDQISETNPAPVEMNEISESAMLETAGWGATKEQGSGLPEILQKVSVPLVSAQKCEKAYPKKITSRMICAGYDAGGKDSCQGDSGGPLFQKIDRKLTLVGIVSWGEGCARANKFGVYSKVSSVTDWINETLN